MWNQKGIAAYLCKKKLLQHFCIFFSFGVLPEDDFDFWGGVGGVGELISDYTSCSTTIFPISCTKDCEKHFPFEWWIIQQNLISSFVIWILVERN